MAIGPSGIRPAGLSFLHGITGLQRVLISGIKLSSRDVTDLCKLDRLAVLEMRDCQVSSSQVSVLTAALPDCRVFCRGK